VKQKYIIIVIAAVVLITAACGTEQSAEKPLSAVELLDLGEKYLLEMNFEQALVQFLKVIEVEPMNPRGYTGAAEAYMGLDETDKAIAILQDGLRLIPENEEIQAMLDEIQQPETEEALSPSEIAEKEPWKLFENPLLADEVTLAGIPFWDCMLEDVQSYYPGGVYAYKDSEGVIRATEGWEVSFMEWDTSYDTHEIQYSTEGSHKYAGFHGTSEIRGIYMGMDMDEALTALGLSSDGIALVKEEGGAYFGMDENGCFHASINKYPSYEYCACFGYSVSDNKYMSFNVCINDGIVRLIEITLS